MINTLPLIVVQNPWAFLALFALAVPIVLHLISKSQATLVKFANIALITPLPPKRMRQIRLTQFWLLVLRLLLLLISILLLAQVSISKAPISAKEVTVVSADWLNYSNNAERQQLLSSSADMPIYLLANQTKIITSDVIVNWPTKKANVVNKSAVENNSNVLPESTLREIAERENVLQQLDYFSAQLSPDTGIKFFVTNRAEQFSYSDAQQKLILNNAIDWQIKTVPAQASKQYLNNISVVIVYEQARFGELKYFQQALALIKQNVAPNLTVKAFVNDDLANSPLYQQVLNEKPEWLFYLSEKPIDDATANALITGTTLFVEGHVSELMPHKTTTINSSNTHFLTSQVAFYQRAMPLDISGQLSKKNIKISENVLWQYRQPDGSSIPMLTKSTLSFDGEQAENASVDMTSEVSNTGDKLGEVYQLHSKFSPAWSSLLVTKQWPLLLKNLLFGHWQQQVLSKQQTLTSAQISQLVTNPVSQAISLTSQFTAVEHASQRLAQRQNTDDFWRELLMLLLIVLWTLERMVSERSEKSSAAISAKVSD
ncbi:MAG: BatA domain-containing protein [Cognaticolwellia sp.]